MRHLCDRHVLKVNTYTLQVTLRDFTEQRQRRSKDKFVRHLVPSASREIQHPNRPAGKIAPFKRAMIFPRCVKICKH